MAKVTNVKLRRESPERRDFYATWSFDKPAGQTKSYKVRWSYQIKGSSVWFLGSESSITARSATYTAPDKAVCIGVIITPEANKHTVGKKQQAYYTGEASTKVTYELKTEKPETPSSAPTLTLNKLQATMTATDIKKPTDAAYDVKKVYVQFQIMRIDNSTFYQTDAIATTFEQASYVRNVTAGHKYKARYRVGYVLAGNDNAYEFFAALFGSDFGILWSDWSDYSSEVETQPITPKEITSVEALSSTSVRVKWEAVTGATGYTVEYAEKWEYFDASSNVQSVDVTIARAEITGLDSGKRWYFRVKATNNAGSSEFTSSKSTVLGKVPNAPTTWSSTVTAYLGEKVKLYWTPNHEDGSKQRYAILELDVGGKTQSITIKNEKLGDDETDLISEYELDTNQYSTGAKIKWRVKTMGILSDYGPFSVQRTVDVYAPPVVSCRMTTSNPVDGFPIRTLIESGPSTQTPTGYHVSITSCSAYDTYDEIGQSKHVSANEEIFSKNYDHPYRLLDVILLASDLDLQNNTRYKLTATVYMDSGLTADSSLYFDVAWNETNLSPDCEIGVDQTHYTATINPYCMDSDGEYSPLIELSVYRREYDGSFTEIATGIPNTRSHYVTDPHPSIDYARYRIVATDMETGSIGYYDAPGVPFDDECIIIQWNEEWSELLYSGEDESESHDNWAGSIIKLPYNIEISADQSPEVSLVEYAGRKHPVSYYGTQRNETATWNTVIPATDEETLYGIRRLAAWTGDVYVREPSGIGYWANVTVSYNKKYNDLTIPITFTIKRVEGGA